MSITIYTAPNCQPCRLTKREFDRAGVSEFGKPTAIKKRGTEWYDPAITTASGPKRLPHGERKGSRYLAIKEAKRVIEEGDGA